MLDLGLSSNRHELPFLKDIMTPLVILVGFLGAGKTTYLKNLLPQLVKVGIEPHVIINDYENATVDAELFAGLTKHITPINGS